MKIYKPGTILIDTRDKEMVRVVGYREYVGIYDLDCIREGNGFMELHSSLGATSQSRDRIEQYYRPAESYIVNETLERYENI